MKGRSIVEVILVFVCFRIIGWWFRTTEFLKRELEVMGWSYTAGILLIIIPVCILLLTKRSFKSYGLTLSQWRKTLDIGLTYALVSGAIINGIGFMILWTQNISYTEPAGALLLTGLNIVVLFAILSFLRKREKSGSADHPPNPVPNMLLLIILLGLPIATALYMHKLTILVVSTVVWQFLFSGIGEEIMYRGYYQSRINEEFGRPFTFMGVRFGIGVIGSSLLFSLAHIFNPFSPFTGEYELALWWGLFTFFGGFTLGLVREKTGSIIPSGIAHGLPDAVGETFGVLFSFP